MYDDIRRDRTRVLGIMKTKYITLFHEITLPKEKFKKFRIHEYECMICWFNASRVEQYPNNFLFESYRIILYSNKNLFVLLE